MPPSQADTAGMEARARRLRLLLLDVDGVLTDGTIGMTSSGEEWKSFYVRDGSAILWARQSGVAVGLLSGRVSEATTRRAAELKIEIVIQGQTDKLAAFAKVADSEQLEDDEIAFMGDDLLDLPVLMRAGLSAAPADATEAVRHRVHYVTQAAGGRGAVREFIELILRARGQWDALVQRHLA
jgi:3-deoxy-D-manno-octulosonate 8-phosphate phosphatase (KDO 8-P phosphatase)